MWIRDLDEFIHEFHILSRQNGFEIQKPVRIKDPDARIYLKPKIEIEKPQ